MIRKLIIIVLTQPFAIVLVCAVILAATTSGIVLLWERDRPIPKWLTVGASILSGFASFVVVLWALDEGCRMVTDEDTVTLLGRCLGSEEVAMAVDLTVLMAVPYVVARLVATGLALIDGPVRRDRRRRRGLCVKCAYDLTGNVSGVCPECGEPA
jgi:hypothetical protein